MSVTIQKWGNRQGIRIPKAIVEELRWRENESLAMRAQDGKLIIEPEAKRKNIKELFADFDGNYSPVEIDWGDPVGDELW